MTASTCNGFDLNGRGTAARTFGGSTAASGRGILARIVDTLYAWQRRADTRRHLMELDVHMLKDIGLSRADAVREGDKPFWQP